MRRAVVAGVVLGGAVTVAYLLWRIPYDDDEAERVAKFRGQTRRNGPTEARP